MTASTHRKRERPLAALIGAGNGILLPLPVDVVRGHHDPAFEAGRETDELLQALIAYKQRKRN